MSHVCSTLLSDCNTLMMQYINESWLQYIIEWLQYINDAIHEWPTLSIRTCQGRDLLRWAVLSQGCLCVCVGVCVCVCERERVSEIFWGELRCRKCACVCVCVCERERERERSFEVVLSRTNINESFHTFDMSHVIWVMSQIRHGSCHMQYTNESCHTFDMSHVIWVMSQIRHGSCHMQYTNESCHTTDMSHVARVYVTLQTWVMSRITHEGVSFTQNTRMSTFTRNIRMSYGMSHVTHQTWVMSHITHEWVMSHITHEWVMSHIRHESCHT